MRVESEIYVFKGSGRGYGRMGAGLGGLKMRRRGWKEELRAAFEAPAPSRKREFLQKVPRQRISAAGFVLSQAAYINRWSWGVSVLVYAIAAAGAVFFSRDMVWAISGLTPLLALALVSECRRSEKYGMEELEMTTRFSLRSVLLARLGILGTENLTVLCLLVPLGIRNNQMGAVQAGMYIAAPFLLTTFLALWAVRRFRGQEGAYVSAGIAVCVSLLAFIFHREVPALYQASRLGWWAAGSLLLAAGTAKQYRWMIKRTEELS